MDHFLRWALTISFVLDVKGLLDNGSIQTLFLGILKSLNIPIPTRSSESTSKMSQKLKNMRSCDFRILGNFQIKIFKL